MIISVLITSTVSGQTDSLLHEAKVATSDTAKLRNLVLVSEYCDIPDIEKYSNICIRLADSLLELNKYDETDLLFYKSTAINNLGFMHHVYAEYDKAIEQYKKSIAIYEQIQDSLGLSRSLNNIAMVYRDAGDTEKAIELLTKAYNICAPMGDYELHNITLTNFGIIYTELGDIEKASEYLYKAIKLQDEENDPYGLAHSYNTLASMFHSQEDYENSKKYFEIALEKGKESNDYEVLGNSYNNLGFIYDMLEEDSIALDYYLKSLELRIAINDVQGQSECYSNLGSYYIEKGDTAKGVDYIEKAVQIREEIGDANGLSTSYQKIAGILFEKGEFKEALKYGEKSYEIAVQLGYSDVIQLSSLMLSKIYGELKDYKKAYEMHVIYLETRDHLVNKENQKKIIEQQLDYEYAKKHYSDSLNAAKALEISELENVFQQEQLTKAKQRNVAMLVGIFLLVIVVILAFFAYQSKRRSEKTISLQKEKVEQQKHLLEEKHKEITDSINYAERIQRSFLATEELLSQNLGEYFVLLKPKDIVSGDFYWAGKLNNGNFAYCCADSTGHGVPGAIMSILNVSSLEKAVESESEPHLILNKTREIIINRLNKDGSAEGGKDGMDCSLLSLNPSKSKLVFASANNPVIIIRGDEVVEFRGDKMPVGKHNMDQESFNTHEFELKKGDMIYTLTDGFPDQFGGVSNKKYMIKNLKKLLRKIAYLPVSEQKALLENEFEIWRGDIEQIDDMCIMGVRV